MTFRVALFVLVFVVGLLLFAFVVLPTVLLLPLTSAPATAASESVIAATTAATTVLRVFTFSPFLSSIVMGKAQRLRDPAGLLGTVTS